MAKFILCTTGKEPTYLIAKDSGGLDWVSEQDDAIRFDSGASAMTYLFGMADADRRPIIEIKEI